MAANVGQLGAGGVGDFLLGDNGVVDLLLQVLVGRQLEKEGVQHRGDRIGLGVVLHLPGAAEHRGDFQQLPGGEAAAPVGPEQGVADVLGAGQGGRTL